MIKGPLTAYADLIRKVNKEQVSLPADLPSIEDGRKAAFPDSVVIDNKVVPITYDSENATITVKDPA